MVSWLHVFFTDMLLRIVIEVSRLRWTCSVIPLYPSHVGASCQRFGRNRVDSDVSCTFNLAYSGESRQDVPSRLLLRLNGTPCSLQRVTLVQKSWIWAKAGSSTFLTCPSGKVLWLQIQMLWRGQARRSCHGIGLVGHASILWVAGFLLHHWILLWHRLVEP